MLQASWDDMNPYAFFDIHESVESQCRYYVQDYMLRLDPTGRFETFGTEPST